MLLLFLDWLSTILQGSIPAVFSYTSTRMALAAGVSLLLTIFLGPFFIRKLYSFKIGQVIRKEDCPLLGELHAKKENTPTMGGMLILCAILVSLFVFMNLKSIFALLLFITTFGFGLVGGIDDYLKLRYSNTKGLSGRKKLYIQLLFSLLVVLYLLFPSIQSLLHFGSWFAPPNVREGFSPSMEIISYSQSMSYIFIPFIKNPVLSFSGVGLLILLAFYLFVIIGSSNAVNLTDGLDGLATGLIILVAGCLALVAFLSNHLELAKYLHLLYIEGSGEIAVFLSALIGACLGFLWYNGHPAQVFMGDTGSLSLGGILGCSAILLGREFLLAIIGGVFVIETVSVILQVLSFRFRNKRRIFLCAPLHHHYEYKGWAETKVVLRFWIMGLLLAILGVASLKFQ